MKKDKLLAFEIGNCKIREFSPIPGTKEEVKYIGAYFSEKEIYEEENMKTDILLKKGSKADLIHFATHGFLDGQSPLFSSLVFADRNLNVYEIFNLNLKSYLVTLSACSTGLGENVTGDELIGLSRAFIYGGTPSVCVSLWDISDKSTAELMDRFYYYLRYNDKSKALQLAQLDTMKKYKHPYLWSSFILIGDWE